MLRDQLLSELKEVNSTDVAAVWAQRILPAKNSLDVADARRLEQEFEVRLGRVDSFDPEPCCCDRQHREVGSGGFFVAGRDAAKLFEPIDTALDEIAPLIRFPIIFNRCLAIGPRRDNGLDASVHQIVANFVAVVALVAEEFVRIHIVKFHQRIIAFDLVHLAAGDIESQRVAFGVRAEVDFGREAAARAAERLLILIPPFTPAACWCARTIVESMACSVSAAGPRLASVSKAASQTPSLLQRVKRMKTEFQFPYRSGMSRQGAPVRKTQRMPLTVRRLSGIAGPRSPRSGSNGSRMRHSESVRSPRTQCCLLQKGSLKSKLNSSVKNCQHSLAQLTGQAAATEIGARETANGMEGGYSTRGEDDNREPLPSRLGSIPKLAAGAVDKSGLAHLKPRRIRDEIHVKFVTKQPCLICGRKPSDPHHLRFTQHRALGRKVGDEFIVPMCRGHHRESTAVAMKLHGGGMSELIRPSPPARCG